MELFLSSHSLFVLGAFLGALLGRTFTFGILAVCLLIMLIKL